MRKEPTINGYAHLTMTVHTVGDIRALTKELDKHCVSDSSEVELDRDRVFIVLADGEGEFISCGDHVPPDDAYDVLLNTHKHDQSRDIPAYDWMTIDRYGEDRRPE
jgi:hypothetical protein